MNMFTSYEPKTEFWGQFWSLQVWSPRVWKRISMWSKLWVVSSLSHTIQGYSTLINNGSYDYYGLAEGQQAHHAVLTLPCWRVWHITLLNIVRGIGTYFGLTRKYTRRAEGNCTVESFSVVLSIWVAPFTPRLDFWPTVEIKTLTDAASSWGQTSMKAAFFECLLIIHDIPKCDSWTFRLLLLLFTSLRTVWCNKGQRGNVGTMWPACRPPDGHLPRGMSWTHSGVPRETSSLHSS